jgi:hypothetical protein
MASWNFGVQDWGRSRPFPLTRRAEMVGSWWMTASAKGDLTKMIQDQDGFLSVGRDRMDGE